MLFLGFFAFLLSRANILSPESRGGSEHMVTCGSTLREALIMVPSGHVTSVALFQEGQLL